MHNFKLYQETNKITHQEINLQPYTNEPNAKIALNLSIPPENRTPFLNPCPGANYNMTNTAFSLGPTKNLLTSLSSSPASTPHAMTI